MDENARKGKNEDPAAPMGTNIHYGESTRIQKIHDEMKVWLKNLEFRGALKQINQMLLHLYSINTIFLSATLPIMMSSSHIKFIAIPIPSHAETLSS